MFHIYFKRSTKGIILLVTLTSTRASSSPRSIGLLVENSSIASTVVFLYKELFFIFNRFCCLPCKEKCKYSCSVIITLPYSLAHRFNSPVSDSSETKTPSQKLLLTKMSTLETTFTWYNTLCLKAQPKHTSFIFWIDYRKVGCIFSKYYLCCVRSFNALHCVILRFKVYTQGSQR